ncbi:hypothetical protein C2S52_022402 [Perilla frutescens var. hirtella]|uniref:Protein BIG GRAIN 1-like E n=1 Tax=Perilla frutescens var. hirtella TaxID=608512 RepID=A0AAD4P1W3_PERFH|nr:hypothetical protein C2S52_022402 [Perilla frutescens var. hirtella]KAH6823121.1 hypothetical protein C2S53_011294 [Perilla frutescens var. hirtella]
MSVASKNSSHRRNDSGELVVFEAARYFSGGDENPCHYNSSAGRDNGRRAATARMSLDMAAINLPTIQKQYLMREKIKKHKQPSSPGGRLATFLNSLFNQTNSKKKKKSKTSAAADEDDDHHHTPDQRRRSSISHFTITTSAANYDSNSSAKTPTKSSYKDLKSFSDRQKAVSLQKNGGDIAVNEQFRFNNGSFRNPTTKWTADDGDQRVVRKFDDIDDGDDSDSSSDLFDLPSLDFFSTGLPVYGTTNMDRIVRIGAPITSAAAV